MGKAKHDKKIAPSEGLWDKREKKLRVLVFAALSLMFIVPAFTLAQSNPIVDRLAGRILIATEQHGEAWYLDPSNRRRYKLGNAEEAYGVMRSRGLGIKHAELLKYLKVGFPKRLSGRILLDVEMKGEAYYILPGKMKGLYLRDAADALRLMRIYGLGISNKDLAKIPSATVQPPTTPKENPSQPVVVPIQVSQSGMEKQVFDKINEHRKSIGVQALAWNDSVALQARTHSQNMASQNIPVGHTGFQARVDALMKMIGLSQAAENVNYNNDPQPVEAAVKGWLNSPGHKVNLENPAYNQTAVGIAMDGKGGYFFTQFFTKTP